MTSIFEGQPPQNKAFSNQNKGHFGSRYVYIHPLKLNMGTHLKIGWTPGVENPGDGPNLEWNPSDGFRWTIR